MKKVPCILWLIISVLSSACQLFGQTNHELLQNSSPLLQRLTMLDVVYLFEHSRKELIDEFRIIGETTANDGYLDVDVYAQDKNGDYVVRIASMTRDQSGQENLDIEIKQNIQDARLFGVGCASAERSKVTIMEVAGFAFIVSGLITFDATRPLAFLAFTLGVYKGYSGIGKIIYGDEEVGTVDGDEEEAEDDIEYFVQENGDYCGVPNPLVAVMLVVSGQSFNLTGILIPGIHKMVYPEDFLADKNYEIRVDSWDGELVTIPWNEHPEMLKSTEGSVMGMYIPPGTDDPEIKYFPSLLLGSRHGNPGLTVQLSVLSGGGDFLVLSDPEIFKSSSLSDLEHTDLGAYAINGKMVENDELLYYTLNLYRVRVYGSAKAEFEIGEYGPYIFTDDFAQWIDFDQDNRGIHTQGTGFEFKAIQVGQTIGNGPSGDVTISDDLWPALEDKVLLAPPNDVPAKHLIIHAPQKNNAIYAITHRDEIEELCQTFVNSFGGNCLEIGAAFGEFKLIRANNFDESISQKGFKRINVDWDRGPFLAISCSYREATTDDAIDAVGFRLKEPFVYPDGSGFYDIRAGSVLGEGDYKYTINSMSDGYYTRQGQMVLPSVFAKLDSDFAKAFSRKDNFFVVATPEAMPGDWDVFDWGEFFVASNSQGEKIFHLFGVYDAKGELFTITNEGPYLVGALGGTLDTSHDQFINMSNFFPPPPEPSNSEY